MTDDKKTPSRMRTFRFNDAMEKDLNFLADLWGCTATDAIARALTNAVTLERVYIVQTKVKNDEADKQALWRAEMEHRIYSQPLASLQSLDTSTGEVAKSDPIQTQTAAGESAASVPTKTKGGNKVRYQFKIFLKNEPDTRPGTPSGETAEIAIANAKKWLREHGREDFEPYFPAGTHCKTFKI